MVKKRTAVLLVILAMIIGGGAMLALTNYPIFASSGASSSASASTGLSRVDMNKLNAAVKLIEDNYYKEVDHEKLVTGAINGIVGSLEDPYSAYMPAEQASEFNESIQGSFTGIGAEVELKNEQVTVISPIKGSPAEKAGVQAKDVLLSVDGESLAGLDLQTAVSKIRGPKGSKVTVMIKRPGTQDPIKFEITRSDIKLETVNARMEDGGIGIIEVTQFSTNTGERFKEELSKLEQKGMEGLVIDLRSNPGGLLDVVVDMSKEFVPKGSIIVQEEERGVARKVFRSSGTAKLKDYPVTVLINGGSASASEIMAGALQESAGAKLLGENSFGKGTVQTSVPNELGKGTLLKLTIAKWLTPDAEWIHEKGIKPDEKVSQPDYFTVAPINKEKTWKSDMNNESIKSAQVMLSGLGYDTKRKDGYFDAETKKQVQAFQQAQKMTVSGMIDEKTAVALEAATLEAITDPANDTQLNRAIKELKQGTLAPASNS
ncbi:S41 family peptidase [Saccharibacillus brassicae]|uniref:PDZ domain-containing protein n=1 Tax=Saccharibacillus brassicae TaxID=2583377 RepID=A0A4Y6UT24_SACBS|nr:S41 family peptidase [Saccharibacillus brassicae]QDH20809.1 PDZ domain-containing protein [Saccharibacillus brassicae]